MIFELSLNRVFAGCVGGGFLRREGELEGGKRIILLKHIRTSRGMRVLCFALPLLYITSLQVIVELSKAGYLFIYSNLLFLLFLLFLLSFPLVLLSSNTYLSTYLRC